MERSLKLIKDREQQEQFDFIFQNAVGNPVIFASATTKSQMKANSWGKVKADNTALYIRFGDGGAMKITGTDLS